MGDGLTTCEAAGERVFLGRQVSHACGKGFPGTALAHACERVFLGRQGRRALLIARRMRSRTGGNPGGPALFCRPGGNPLCRERGRQIPNVRHEIPAGCAYRSPEDSFRTPEGPLLYRAHPDDLRPKSWTKNFWYEKKVLLSREDGSHRAAKRRQES